MESETVAFVVYAETLAGIVGVGYVILGALYLDGGTPWPWLKKLVGCITGCAAFPLAQFSFCCLGLGRLCIQQ